MMPLNRWLEFALDDLDSAEIMMREGKYNNVCYFSHQAAEKGLKGFLENNRVNPPRIHDLVELLKLCKNLIEGFEQFLPQARTLNQFYIPTRYPVAPPGAAPEGMPSRPLAEKALNYAKEIVEYCRVNLI